MILPGHLDGKKLMAEKHKWEWPARFRRGMYGWKGSALAAKRLGEAVREIKKVARCDPVPAADAAVRLLTRIPPAFVNIDTSSGMLGAKSEAAIKDLTGIIIKSNADVDTRRRWMETLYEAAMDDGGTWLGMVQERWGEMCADPDLAVYWADFLLDLLKSVYGEPAGGFMSGELICLSSLLAAGRYDELRKVLLLRKRPNWHANKYYAAALLRQGKVDEALEYAAVTRANTGYSHFSIDLFCERALIDAGRSEEAFVLYALANRTGQTYLAQFRSIVEKYPDHDRKQLLASLVKSSENPGDWFATARREGLSDMAIDCALKGRVNPSTLVRAARDTAETEPEFAATVALRAIELLLAGASEDTALADTSGAFKHLMTAANKLGSAARARAELEMLLAGSSNTWGKTARHILQEQMKRTFPPGPYLVCDN